MFGYSRFKIAYTLAEMLLVLVILAVMVLALPPLVKKTFKVNTIEKKHGRVECFYDNSGNLKQYEIIEGNEPVLKTVDSSTGCTFYPPSNATYIMIHSVGGGGAGYSAIGSIGDDDNYKTTVYAKGFVNNTTLATWPDWFKYLKKNYPDDIKSSANTNSFQIKKSFTEQNLLYGLNGQAGERISMFFPFLSSKVKITMKPGVGAAATSSNGQNSRVYFRYPSDDFDTLIIDAAGGESGSDSVYFATELSGGEATDFGVGKLQNVKLRSSTFEDVLESSDSKQESMVNKDATVKAGWGGNGSYFYIGGSALNGNYTYQVNNYSQTQDSDENTLKTDYWQTVTSKIPLSFYKRGGKNNNCTLTSGNVQISGSCYKTTGTDKYTCKIKDGAATYTLYGDGSCTTGSCLATDADFTNVTSMAGTMTGCTFDADLAEITCNKSSVASSTHNCTYTGSVSDFSCPDGISAYTSRHGDGWGICRSNSGGNGAIVILW